MPDSLKKSFLKFDFQLPECKAKTDNCKIPDIQEIKRLLDKK